MNIARIAVCGILLAAATASALAQNYRGEAVPVIDRANTLEFSRMRFLTFTFGREGPTDAPLATPPVAGREYFVEADVFGIESAASIRFELVDTAGRSLQILTMWKATDAVDDGEFYGFLTTPNQPFRAVISGTSVSGQTFRLGLSALVQPAPDGPPERASLPPGLPAGAAEQIQGMIEEYRKQLRERRAQAVKDHPEGVIALSRAIVSGISYEPLQTPPIGLRLRYSIRVPSRSTIVGVPNVFPSYPAGPWRGVVAMKPIDGTITPPPRMAGAQSLRDVIVYQGAATYEAGVTYTFVVDMAPDYVFQGTETGRFCIYEQKFTNRAVWESLIASEAAAPYTLSITDTGTRATIPAFFPQRTFYEAFKSKGAADCGPIPNVRF